MKKLILALLCLTSTLNAEQGANPTTLVDPEWEFFDDFEGAVDNTFWAGSGQSLNYGVDRPDADSKVLEMIYVPNSEGIPHGDDALLGDSWTEYDFNLGINAVQVEVSFRLFTPADYISFQGNQKFFYLYSGPYGHSNANIVMASSNFSNYNGTSTPGINLAVDGDNYGFSWNLENQPIHIDNEGGWSTYTIFFELAEYDGDYGYYEVAKDGEVLISTDMNTLSDWGRTGKPHGPSTEMIKYSQNGNFLDKGTLLGWAGIDPRADKTIGFAVPTKFLIDDFRIRANSVHGAASTSDIIFTNGFE